MLRAANCFVSYFYLPTQRTILLLPFKCFWCCDLHCKSTIKKNPLKVEWTKNRMWVNWSFEIVEGKQTFKIWSFFSKSYIYFQFYITLKSNPARGIPSTPELKLLQNICSMSSNLKRWIHMPFIKKSVNETALFNPNTRKRKAYLLETENPESVLQCMVTDIAPNWQYIHSRTNHPVLDEKWQNDNDDTMSLTTNVFIK